MTPDIAYCEHCTHRIAAFYTKTQSTYLQTCQDCYDDLHDTAPNNTMVVHDIPAQHNYDEITTAVKNNTISPLDFLLLFREIPTPALPKQ